MKNICFMVSLFFLTAITGFAQQKPVIQENKYRINLPEYWKPGNKVWQILSDKLPLVCEELRDKELCGDECRPKYTIEFQMSEPLIHNYKANAIASSLYARSYNFVTAYSFESSLLLFDDTDKLITRVILVDLDEVWTVTNRAELRAYTPTLPLRNVLLTVSPRMAMAGINYQNQSIREMTGGSQEQTPYSYINDNMEKLAPARKDMLTVIDQKIRKL